jgi:hypothetical protein
MKTVNKEPAMILFCNASSGKYIPQRFVSEISPQFLTGVSQDEINELADPDSEYYWETWENILNNAKVKINDDTYTLMHDGDLWLICYERMTEEEKENFGMYD